MEKTIDRLVVGGIGKAGSSDFYRAHEIKTVVRVTNQCPRDGYPQGVIVYPHPMADGSHNRYEDFVRGAARVLYLLRETDERLLVHCTVGASRSVGVAAAALAVHDGGSVDAWVERLATGSRRPTEPVLEHARAFVDAVAASTGANDG